MENVAATISNHFGLVPVRVETLTAGLIHKTYKATAASGNSIILQQVNTTVFPEPEKIIENYLRIREHLHVTNQLEIPALIKTSDNQYVHQEGEFYWRAFAYMTDSYTENLPAAHKTIYSAARCYGSFVLSLQGMDISKLHPVIPGFHDLNYRYIQLQQAIFHATPARLQQSQSLQDKIEERKQLIDFYNRIPQNPAFKIRVMHHDCKLSNILFNRHTNLPVCPIDLDTTMPGHFFSDIGDMIRSMVSDTDENGFPSNITIRKDCYEAIVEGYRAGIKDAFTETENSFLHHSGLLIIYMQGIRFLTDYLSNDTYYQTTYPNQNFDRALNQLTLLEKLEEFLLKEYNYTA